MFGISDPWINLVYILCVLSALLCVVYGLMNWNKGGENESNEILEEKKWEEKEKEIEM